MPQSITSLFQHYYTCKDNCNHNTDFRHTYIFPFLCIYKDFFIDAVIQNFTNLNSMTPFLVNTIVPFYIIDTKILMNKISHIK